MRFLAFGLIQCTYTYTTPPDGPFLVLKQKNPPICHSELHKEPRSANFKKCESVKVSIGQEYISYVFFCQLQRPSAAKESR